MSVVRMSLKDSLRDIDFLNLVDNVNLEHPDSIIKFPLSLLSYNLDSKTDITMFSTDTFIRALRLQDSSTPRLGFSNIRFAVKSTDSQRAYRAVIKSSTLEKNIELVIPDTQELIVVSSENNVISHKSPRDIIPNKDSLMVLDTIGAKNSVVLEPLEDYTIDVSSTEIFQSDWYRLELEFDYIGFFVNNVAISALNMTNDFLEE